MKVILEYQGGKLSRMREKSIYSSIIYMCAQRILWS